MPTLDTLGTEVSPVHLLLIGDSKAGKSTYATEAAVDGFEVVYIDADNGRSAMDARIRQLDPKEQEKVRQRINYFRPRFPLSFVRNVLKGTNKKPLLWLPNHDKVFKATDSEFEAGEPLWVFNMEQISHNAVLVIDSWTALAADGLEIARPDQMSSLLDGSADQSLYGEARIQLVYISNMLQGLPCHVIVQAHSTRYEIYEKPKGSSGVVKQRELTLVETIEVPISSSRAHGLEMASRFNHIGRLEITPTGMVEIDFTRQRGRVGGGPPNKKAKVGDLRFSQLVDASGVRPESSPVADAMPWYQESTVGEVRARLKK